jgi:hypothetical protein
MDRVHNSIITNSFISRHRVSASDFTRKRILTFQVLFTMLLQKGHKSLQLYLNELIPGLGLSGITVSNMAYSKARRKLKHTAFIELNQTAVITTMYEDGEYKTFKHFRVLACDGSKIRLPEDNPEVAEVFGVRSYRAGGGAKPQGAHAMALASVFYDVLNRVSLDAQLLPVATHEITAAISQLKGSYLKECLTANDLIVQDRGYHSYRMFAVLTQTKAQFVVRAKRGSGMRIVDDMLAGNGSDNRIATVTLSKHLAERPDYQNLPAFLKLRFVRIVLLNGSYEVLATSVLENERLSLADLKELYHLRWGIETFFGILKNRLGLGNFSGYSVEAIRQDFFVTVFLGGVESIFTEDAEATLTKQRGGHPKKVNKAVSFNAIKDRAWELFISTAPQEQVVEELETLFLTNPTLIRKDRNPPRKRHPDNKVLDFYKQKRKTIF